MHESSPTQQVSTWLSHFGSALKNSDFPKVLDLFCDECYWRDLISFTWNIKTFESKDEIVGMLQTVLSDVKPDHWAIEGAATVDGNTTKAFFAFETAVARGKGLLSLQNGKCLTLLTTMTELKGFEEHKGEWRESGVQHRAKKHRKNWLELKEKEEAELGYIRQPYCVIIGGGQGGIALGARLKRLGVPTIIVEKNKRAGDSWRNRYKSLVLHDPVWFDPLPYLPFPDDWPVFTPKDKMGDWLEIYTKAMELNYWSSTECISASYDDETEVWTVLVNREGEKVTLNPKQLVFATGAYGPPKEPRFTGMANFKGDCFHSGKYTSGEKYAGKNCVVVGSASSGHDICVDLWENDAHVTMIQRSPTIVIRSETLMELGFKALYSEQAVQSGITTEIADMIFASVPFKMMPAQQIPLYEEIAKRDSDLYERLAVAGFHFDFGEDGSGLMMKALRTASGYYIDVGASDLIAEGEIKVKSGVEISEIKEHSVFFADGTELPADLIVFAIGFESMNEWLAKIISREVADRIGICWGIGSGVPNDPGPWEGELRNMWKPTRQKALWFHGGNLHLSRFNSLFVSLQIKARMEGIPTPVYSGS